MRQKVTLSLDEDLYREMRIQAVKEDRDVSTITEKLYAEYLRSVKREGKPILKELHKVLNKKRTN